MKNNKYVVWFYGGNVEVWAISLHNAVILALAERIKSGLETVIMFVEDEEEKIYKYPSVNIEFDRY